MDLGRGFKYFLQTTTRFPTTNLDLYIPRKLSTTEVSEIVDLGNFDADVIKTITEASTEETQVQSDDDSDDDSSKGYKKHSYHFGLKYRL